MSDNRTKQNTGGGGRLATLQPGVIGWHRNCYIDNIEFSEWFRIGEIIDGKRASATMMESAEIVLKVE